MKKGEPDFFRGLKWLMFFRVIFTTFLLGSTIMLQMGQTSHFSVPIAFLYGMIIFVFLISFFYALLVNRLRNYSLFAYIQIVGDTFVVTMIIYITGSFSSIFSFLYLLVIIYSSILLPRKGSLIIVALSIMQYGIMVTFEYYGILKPLGIQNEQFVFQHELSYVFYRVIMIMVACFAVAFLSSCLAEREQRSQKELKAMESHMKRVAKLAGIGEMAAGLAHEIKNPLASLSGAIQILREETRYDPLHDKLMQIVLREADRLSSLVTDFLMFARPPAGKAQHVELDRVVQETVSLFEKGKICQNRLTIIKDLTGGIWINMDPMHLRQVLWNLLLNAAESIENKGNIFIRTKQTKGNYVVVEIEDTGCGMTPEQIQFIFDPFFTTKPNGTGLGLSIVHSVLKSYDGRLDVESESDSGSKMILTLKKIEPATPQLKLDTIAQIR